MFVVMTVLTVLKVPFEKAAPPCPSDVPAPLSIDESLMLWKGRLGWRQYIPSKRARYGIKSYEICDSQSGYIWIFLFILEKRLLS